MNEAVFEKIYVVDDRVTGEVLNPPFDELVSAQRIYDVEQAAGRPSRSERPKQGSKTAALAEVLFGDVSSKAIFWWR